MAARTTLITTGNYDSYKTVEHVEGPDRPAISTLHKEFVERYGFADKSVLPTEPGYYDGQRLLDALRSNIRGNINGSAEARRDGLVGSDEAELFIDWLRKRKGYTTAPIKEFHI